MKKCAIFILFFVACSKDSSPTAPEIIPPPTVQSFTVTTPEDSPLDILLLGSDSKGALLTYSFSQLVTKGQISLENNIAKYNPFANFFGTDSFKYVANSVNGISNIGIVLINVSPVDDEPSTMDVDETTDEDTAVTINFDLTEVDGQDVIFSVTNNPSNGSVSISGNSAIYTPNQDWNGTDQFNFQVVDSSARSILNEATATITVNPINDAPIVNDLNAEMDENRVTGRYQPVTITFEGEDIEGDDLTFSVVENPTNGTLSEISDNQIVYTPNQDYNGDETFTYKANDGIDDSNTATVTITINAINDAPVIPNEITQKVFNYTEDNPSFPTEVIFSLPKFDVDGDSLNYWIWDEQFNSEYFTFDGDTTVTFSRESQFSGAYQSYMWVSDGIVDSVSVYFDIQFNGGYGLKKVSEWTAGWKEHAELRDPAVSYVPWYSLGTTGYIIENRAGGVNLSENARDFDRFDYWTMDASSEIELDFSHPSLAWNYLYNNVEGYVPFTMYRHNYITGQKEPMFAAFLDADGNDTFDIATDSNGDPVWQGPLFESPGWDPIYGYVSFDTSGDGVVDWYYTTDADNDGVYDNDARYISENDAFTSGGCGWGAWDPGANPDHYLEEYGCPGAYANNGAFIEFPFVTSIMFTDYLGFGVLPDAAGIATGAYQAYKWTGASSIVFETRPVFIESDRILFDDIKPSNNILNQEELKLQKIFESSKNKSLLQGISPGRYEP